MKAIQSNPFAIQHATNELKKNRDLFFQLIEYTCTLFQIISDDEKSNKDLMLEAIKCSPFSYQFFYSELQKDRAVFLMSRRNGEGR